MPRNGPQPIHPTDPQRGQQHPPTQRYGRLLLLLAVGACIALSLLQATGAPQLDQSASIWRASPHASSLRGERKPATGHSASEFKSAFALRANQFTLQAWNAASHTAAVTAEVGAELSAAAEAAAGIGEAASDIGHSPSSSAEAWETDGRTGLRVPSFWKPEPGTDLDVEVHQIRGLPSVLLMVSSYRDFQCTETLESALARATQPQRIRMAVVQQIAPGDELCEAPLAPCETSARPLLCEHRRQLTVFTMAAANATGPVYARHIGSRMYRGEAFVLQVDAHSHFVRGWDVQLIEQWRSTRNEYAVLSTYLTDVQGSIDASGRSLRRTRPIMCNSAFREGNRRVSYLRHASQPEEVPVIGDEPMLQPYWGAGFHFSRGHWVVRVPYDCCLPMVFMGEEISMGVRAWTHGYDVYAPLQSVVFHEYSEKSERRKNARVHKFFENRRDAGVEARSLRRLTSLIGLDPTVPNDSFSHEEQDRYGVGAARPLSEFYRIFQIDVRHRTAKPICGAVRSGLLHSTLRPLLRPDGKGIDYLRLRSFALPVDPAAPKPIELLAKLPIPTRLDPYLIRARYLRHSTGRAEEAVCASHQRAYTCFKYAQGRCGNQTARSCCPHLRDSVGGPAPTAQLLSRLHVDSVDGPDELPPRLLCIAYTIRAHHSSHALPTARTWMPRCDGAVILSDSDDATLPAVAVPHEGPEVYGNVWQKTRANWRYIHAHYRDEFDYFIFGGDDYFVMVDNLKHYLRSEAIAGAQRNNSGLFIGRRFRIEVHAPEFGPAKYFNSGGPGYVLNRAALLKLVAWLPDGDCYPHIKDPREDVWVAHCLFLRGVAPQDTRDELGRERFHPFWPEKHLEMRNLPQTDWYLHYSIDLKYGFECCSTRSIAFHYLKADDMQRVHDLVYRRNEATMSPDSECNLH